MKPIIGVVPSIDEKEGKYFIYEENINALSVAGGVPIILPYSGDKLLINNIVDMIDGLYLTGGNDINPLHFNEEPHLMLGTVNQQRDEFELTILKKVLDRKKPVLGVCKGCQMINVALGGSLYQDINTQMKEGLLQHEQQAKIVYPTHHVNVVDGSLLYKICALSKINVNSRHHQAVKTLGDSLKVCGTANDGVIEAIESDNSQYILGVQWHPEYMVVENDETSKKIYQSFIKASYRKLHKI